MYFFCWNNIYLKYTFSSVIQQVEVYLKHTWSILQIYFRSILQIYFRSIFPVYLKYTYIYFTLVREMLNWETRPVISHQYPKDINDKFLEIIDDCYLEQLVTFPTRASNTFDLLLTNRPSLLKRYKSTPSFGDHNSAILSDIQCHPHLLKPIQQKIYNWNKTDKGQLRADIATHMDMFIQKNTVQTPINDLWLEFSSIINL